MAPHPTAQTPGPNWLNFFVEAPQEDTFRGIGGIFEFRLRSWNIGAFVLILEPFGGSKNTLKWATKSSLSWLLGWNSKIPPMPLKVSSWGAYKKNLSQFGPGVWAVGGGAIDFGPTTSYNSGTSVYTNGDQFSSFCVSNWSSIWSFICIMKQFTNTISYYTSYIIYHHIIIYLSIYLTIFNLY